MKKKGKGEGPSIVNLQEGEEKGKNPFTMLYGRSP